MERAFRWSAAGALALTLTQVVSGATLAQGPVLEPERGSYSFRGLRVAVGAQSQAMAIVLRSAGRMPLQNVVATASGDFVITANTCAATTLPAAIAAATTPRARCSVAVAFKPSAPGLRLGALTLSADGAAPQTVTLDGGVPVGIPSTAVGASAVQWVELPAPAALSASVSGPFAIALRTSYAYGAIDGVPFATTTSTTGACAVTSGTACSLYLGIELLPSAPVGTSTGTVTLSNGVTYLVSGAVLGSALDVEPSSLNAGSIPVGSRSDAATVTITNLSTAAFAVGAVSVTGPFTATSSCPASLASLASCILSVTFKPTAVGEAFGYVQMLTGAGDVGIAASGTGAANPATISLVPATLNLPLLAGNVSGNRRIALTNLSSSQFVTIGAPTGNVCASGGTQCIDFTSQTCTTLSPGGSCQFLLHYVGAANEVSGVDTLQVPVTVGSTTSTYSIVVQHGVPTASAPAVLTLSTNDLRFPATVFGSASAAETFTIKNVAAVPLSITIGSIADFVADPTCVPLAPGASCSVAVHFVPTSGNTHASGVLNLVAYDYSTTTNGAILGNAGVTVSGTSISNAALASPAYPPLIQPVPSDNGFTITNSASVPLIIAGVYGDPYYGAAFDGSACPASLSPGADCSVVVSAPCTDDLVVCHLFIASNSPSSPDEYALSSNPGNEPNDLDVDTAGPVVFAETAVGSTSSVYQIGVNLFEFEVDSPFSVPFNVTVNTGADFAIKNGCPSVLSPTADRDFYQAKCSISVQFTPQSGGFKTATLRYASGLNTRTLLIAGTAPGAGLTVSPATLFLGAPAGQTATQTVTVSNPSGVAIGLSSITVAGSGAASFSVGSTTCGDSVAAGASCAIAVVYTTPGTNLATANLLVTLTSGVVETVGLSGVIPALLESGTFTGSFPFGVTTVGNTAHTTVGFYSHDGYPITVTSVALTGPNATSYSIVSETCTGSALGGTSPQTTLCQLDLAFAPKKVGSLPETLEFKSTVGVTDFVITGTGGPIAAIVSPATLDFGSQAVGVPSAPRTIVLANPNSIALSVDGAGKLGGANVGDFAVRGTCSEIPANGSCSYSLVFTPAALGARTATLPIFAGDSTFYSNGVKPTTTVVLVGGGIANATPGVNLSAATDVVGISIDGVAVPAGGLDGLSDAYSARLLGKSLSWSGSYFTFGNAGVADAVSSSTVALPAGKFAALKLLATAVRSNQPSQTFVVNYTDGTSTSSKQSVSSWTTPQNYVGEAIAATMAYRLNPDGTKHPGSYNLYGYSLALDITKTVMSVTLPKNRNVVVLAMDLVVTHQVPLDLSEVANLSAVHDDGVVVDAAGIDGLGDAYSAQLLGTSLTAAGVTFNLPEVLPLDALANTTLALPTGSFSKLGLLATGVRGNQLNHAFIVTYTDGTSATFKQNFSDWHTPQGFAGETTVLSMPYRLNLDGSKHMGTYSVYGYTIALDATKTVQSLTLPKVSTVVVLAATLSP